MSLLSVFESKRSKGKSMLLSSAVKTTFSLSRGKSTQSFAKACTIMALILIGVYFGL